MKRLARGLLLLVLLAAAGFLGYGHWRERNLSAVQRGWRVAHDHGCFTCHGPGGMRGMANPGYFETEPGSYDEVPPFSGGLLTMYAQSEGEIREWILDGLPARVRRDPEQMRLRERAVIRMPPWRGIIGGRKLDDLVSYVKAMGDFETPAEDRPAEGKKVAEEFGCFNCHGPQGRGSMPNVNAFKGYIPSWDGDDFADLARSEAEIREWILDGSAARLRGSRLARFFLARQPIRMPAYRGWLKEEQVNRLVDYIRWVRAHPYR
jgi:mono/diheme cytochrome c family protein